MQSLSAECSYNLIFDGGKLMMIASIVSIHVITENDGEAGGGRRFEGRSKNCELVVTYENREENKLAYVVGLSIGG